MIVHLKRDYGSLCMDPDEIEAMTISFYTGFFTTQDCTTPGLVTQHVPRKVTDEMNNDLSTPFSKDEVQTTLFMMHPNKAPGSDGFTVGFFQKHWQLIKEDVSKVVLNFLNGDEMPDSVNNSVLAFIPKLKNPQDLTNFRPIALCNVLYKICSKRIANKLRRLIDAVISEEQSTFILGQLIIDNLLIAYESIHYLKKEEGKVKGMCSEVGHDEGI
jgi:hypothetical protein